MRNFSRSLLFTVILLAALTPASSLAQDWIHAGSNLGAERLRIAASDLSRWAPTLRRPR